MKEYEVPKHLCDKLVKQLEEVEAKDRTQKPLMSCFSKPPNKRKMEISFWRFLVIRTGAQISGIASIARLAASSSAWTHHETTRGHH